MLKMDYAGNHPMTIMDWASKVNICISTAISILPVEQYGILKFHIRRVRESFKVIKVISDRYLEGSSDFKVVMEKPRHDSGPLTWIDWITIVQFDMLKEPPVPDSNSSRQLDCILEHLNLVHSEIDLALSNAEGLRAHVEGFIL